MRVLCTGGLGMIGSHLVEALVEKGDEVTVLDDCSSPSLATFDARSDVCIVKGTLSTLDHWRIAPWRTYGPFETVWHLASPVGPSRMTMGAEVLWRIIEGARYVLRYCTQFNAKLCVFSTSELYGYSGGCLHEDGSLEVSLPYDPRMEYPIGKMAMECMLLASGYTGVQIVRPFNVVGPRQSLSGGWVLARFVDQVKKGEPLTIFGDGQQRRVFTSVHDVVDFCLLLRIHWPETPSIWNVGNPLNAIRIKDLASLVIKTYGKGTMRCGVDPAVATGNPDYREAPEKFPCIDKARALGWEPIWDLESIVEEVLRDEHLHD